MIEKSLLRKHRYIGNRLNIVKPRLLSLYLGICLAYELICCHIHCSERMKLVAYRHFRTVCGGKRRFIAESVRMLEPAEFAP